LGGRLFVGGTTAFGNAIITDASFNSRILVGSDVSLGGRLFVNGTTSLNGDVSMNGNLQVAGYVLASMFQINTVPMVLSAQTTSATISGLKVLNDSSFNGNAQVKGNLILASGITPIYSVPNFTSAQVGYSGTVNQTVYTPTNGTMYNWSSSTFTITPGVWILNSTLFFNTTTSTTSWNIFQSIAGSGGNTYLSNTLPNSTGGVVMATFYTVTTPTTTVTYTWSGNYNYVGSTPTNPGGNWVGYLQFTRIA
jgi:hypothetical protein